MAVSAQFNAFVLDLLGAVRPVTARRMLAVSAITRTIAFAMANDDEETRTFRPTSDLRRSWSRSARPKINSPARSVPRPRPTIFLEARISVQSDPKVRVH
jgi:hypothetical protein